MIKMSIAVHRLPNLTPAEFQDHWQNIHAHLIKSIAQQLGIIRYRQSVFLAKDHGLTSDASIACDGIAEVYFDNTEAITIGHKSPAARAALKQLAEDEAKFIDTSRSRSWWSTEREIF